MTGIANKLSTEAYARAVKFIQTQARPLEQKRFAYHFENGSAEAVLVELARFQNPDGGFGHGLEADFQLKDSSVIATTIAFQRFREIKAPATDPVVVNACRYLNMTFRPDTLNWPIIPANADDAPHAPWWEYDGELSRSLSNPRAEIAGYLYDYADHFTPTMPQQVTDSVMAYLLAQPDQLEMHDLLCYCRLYDSGALPGSIKSTLFEKLKRIMFNIVARDPTQWREYGLPPLGVVTSPASPFAPLFANELDANLSFVIEQQTASGCWSPSWSWDFVDAEAWARAEHDWQGVLTLDSLCLLNRFSAIM